MRYLSILFLNIFVREQDREMFTLLTFTQLVDTVEPHYYGHPRDWAKVT